MPDNQGLTAVYVLTRQGLTLARRLEKAMDARVHVSDSLTAMEPSPLPGALHRPAVPPLQPAGRLTAGIPSSGPTAIACRDSGTRHGVTAGIPSPAPECRAYRSFSRLADLLRECFHDYACHIFITAAGIAVRTIAPLLRGKALDPAVLVIDQRGRFVISLLSGHLGGGNAMAARVADILGAVPVITTATDVEDLPALDVLARDRGLAVADVNAVKAVSAALLAGEIVSLHDPDNCLGIAGSRWETFFRREPDLERALKARAFGQSAGDAVAAAGVVVTERIAPPPEASAQSGPDTSPRLLILHPRRLFVGIGCRKATSERDILRRVREGLSAAGLSFAAVAGLASIDAKRDEPGLLAAAKSLGLPLYFFAPAELAAYPVNSPSAKARERFGIAGVCEPAALAAAGRGARLIVAKMAGEGVTVAVARTEDNGRQPGWAE